MAAASCYCVSTGKCAHCMCARSNRQCRNCYPSRKGTCENYVDDCSSVESLEDGAACSSDSAPCSIASSSVSLVSEESAGPCLPCFERVDSHSLGLGCLDGELFYREC